MVKPFVFAFAALVGLMGAAGPALAQSRPLVTEDPETVPAGHVLIEAGLDFAHGADFPASGLGGNLWRIGLFGASIGVGPITELQFDGGLRQRLTIVETDSGAPLASLVTVTGDSTGDAEDLRVGAKIRFAGETASRPAMAARFSTRLTMASPESGLGAGTMDFDAGVALGKTVRSVRTVVNVGLGFVGDPVDGHHRHTMVNYGGSLARAVRTGVEIVGELAGRLNTEHTLAAPGGGGPSGGRAETRTALRFGGRITRGPVRVDSAVMIGLSEADPSWGFTLGGTWVFRAFAP